MQGNPYRYWYRRTCASKLSITKTTASRRWFFHFYLNTGKPFGALGFLNPDEPPELLLFEPPELFLDSFAAAAAACAAEIVAEVPSP